MTERRLWMKFLIWVKEAPSLPVDAFFCVGGSQIFLNCAGNTLWHFQKFLQYIILQLTPSTILLRLPPSPPFLEYFQQVSFFHLHTCVHSICTIFTFLYPFPTSSPLPMGTDPTSAPDRTCSTLLFSNFVKKKKKWHFCFFKTALQSFLVTFSCIYIL
jgi:hypothetical protein